MLKGHSMIELTDVKTGEVERYEDDNLVTNGLQYYFTPMNTTTRLSYNTNIYKTYFSGIKLMDTALMEDPETIRVPVDVGIVGYAGLNADTTDPKRGLFNQAESGVLDDTSGVKLVWDFSQSQANGTISCIGITPNKYVDGDRAKEELYGEITTSKKITYPKELGKIMDYDKNTRSIITHTISKSANSITVYKALLPIWKYGITDDGIGRVRETIVCNVNGISECESIYFIGSNNKYYFFLGFKSRDTSSQPYSLTFLLIKMDKKTFNSDSIEFTFREAAYPNPTQDYYDYSFIRNDFLYLQLFFSGKYVYFKINISDFMLIKKIDIPKLSILSIIDKDAICETYCIGANDEIYVDRKGGYTIGRLFYADCGCYISQYSTVADSSVLIYSCATLFTVNNLSSPVVKTADKTMKITYILREDYGDTPTPPTP